MESVLVSVIIAVIGGTVWLVYAGLQRKAPLNPKAIEVPWWLARLGGTKYNIVTPRILGACRRGK
jgi:hypothetical protein